jgi:alpha-L-rhamnosidase
MAAALDLGGPTKKSLAWAVATDVVQSKHGHHSTGIMGSRYLYHVLTENGFGDIAFAMLHRTDYPSYGYLFERGATTFWENWGEAELDTKWGARSLNHPMQAAMAVWFFDCIGGIRPISPGFRSFEVRPNLLSGLDWARAAHDCNYGKINVHWKRDGNECKLDVQAPPNTTANVVLPVRDGGPATIDGKPIERSPWVKEIVSSRENTQVTIGSGAYVFRWTAT